MMVVEHAKSPDLAAGATVSLAKDIRPQSND